MDKRDWGGEKREIEGVNLIFNKWERDGKGPWDAHDEARGLSHKDRG